MAKIAEARPHLADVIEIRPGAASSCHAVQAPTDPVRLAPSDFAFLWDECPRCFYLKVVRKERRPRMPFPKVFGTIDRAMKSCYVGQKSEALAAGLPAGLICQADRWVRSAGLTIPNSTVVSEIRGSVDALIECDDGSVAVVDFKTAEPHADHVATYGRQLHAYALALEQPASGPPIQVSALGLLCFLPNAFTNTPAAALTGEIRWVEIERDEPAFYRFLIEVASVIDQSGPHPLLRHVDGADGGSRTVRRLRDEGPGDVPGGRLSAHQIWSDVRPVPGTIRVKEGSSPPTGDQPALITESF